MTRDELTKSIGVLAGAATVELLDAYSVKLTVDGESWHRSDERLFSAVIGFVSKGLSATCLIASNEGLLQRSCPSGCQLKDWVGELANQFAGRLKMKLLTHGVEVALSTPLAMSGVCLQPLPRGAFQPLSFVAESGFLVVWIELEAKEGFALGPECASTLQVGELLLF